MGYYAITVLVLYRHDIHTLSKDLGSSVTSFNITGLKLEENTNYYTVVQAYNLAGLHTTEVSDGFMLDLQSPTTGIVHDGFVMTDIHATSSMQSVRSFWHGFSDLESGIKNYEYCVSLNDGMCDVDALHDVGIATRKEYTAAKPFGQGSIVRAGVRASDGSGHVSEIVFSNGIVVDVTPPARVKFDLCEDNIIADFSFEHFPETNETYCHNISNNDWLISERTCIRTLNSNMAEQGRTNILLQGSVSQSLSVENYGRYRLTFYTSTIPSEGQVLSAHEGYIDVGNERYIFLLYVRSNTGSYEWQKHTFFFLLQANDTNLSIGTVKRSTAFAVDNVVFQLYKHSVTEPAESFSHINAHTVFVHDWSSIYAEWIFIDEETEIVEYLWAIGTVQGGTQLQAFTSVGRRTFANAYSLHFEHNSNVHVTVVAINAAVLRTKSYSSPVIIDLTPPTFRYVHDGPDKDMDIDYQKDMEVVTHWDVFDLESDIEECHWAIGTSKGDTSIQTFLNVDINSRNAYKKLSTVPDVSIFSTIRCKNKAGLTSIEYSDGVKILKDAPSVNEVILELMTTSATQFQPRSMYHGNSSEIKFRWTGFRRNEGINSYIVSNFAMS
ncbi:uncharacterized protein LOC123523172 [Mercenaria mercenaria]|uniref:uncharacterized protein LOC123523172 n=1 Tax=Mercenaria mercenaria TaxID=6596 RepID=UPI00234F0089|nr:uncharacterized protein LOC123523172 [Mercenaria mercenaria]